MIYNRFFRDQNLIAPQTVSTGDTSSTGDGYHTGLAVASKFSDYFTRSLPYAQKGAPVSIPLGTEAPVVAGSSTHDTGRDIVFGDANNTKGVLGTNSYGSLSFGSQSFTATSAVSKTNLVADLSHATAATINQLRFVLLTTDVAVND